MEHIKHFRRSHMLVSAAMPDSPTQISILVYDVDQLHTYSLTDLLNNDISLKENQVLWVQVTGLQNQEMIHAIGDHFKLHSLAIEDVLKPYQRPKVEAYDHYEFIVLRFLSVQNKAIYSQQLSMFLGKNYVISFLEHPSEMIENLSHTLFHSESPLRSRGADYLAYSMLDFATDNIFQVLVCQGEKLDYYENKITSKSNENLMREIRLFIKTELRTLRQLLWANREIFNNLLRNELGLIQENNKPYFRDCYDHAISQIDLLESQREGAMTLVDMHLSNMAHQVGYIMKVLTLISVIFTPPMLFTSWWGMNFRNMPELSWPHGYLFGIIIIIMSAIIPLILFWWKKWL